ncbi:hypothetical protein BGX26_001925 [Mortierella sp. AD094]|nr:hypothetical protein BGX26_001925 [Mortierella sp. AD094]
MRKSTQDPSEVYASTIITSRKPDLDMIKMDLPLVKGINSTNINTHSRPDNGGNIGPHEGSERIGNQELILAENDPLTLNNVENNGQPVMDAPRLANGGILEPTSDVITGRSASVSQNVSNALVTIQTAVTIVDGVSTSICVSNEVRMSEDHHLHLSNCMVPRENSQYVLAATSGHPNFDSAVNMESTEVVSGRLQ